MNRAIHRSKKDSPSAELGPASEDARGHLELRHVIPQGELGFDVRIDNFPWLAKAPASERAPPLES